MITPAEISVIVGYVLLMGFLAVGLRALHRLPPGTDARRLSRAAARADRGWRRLVRHLLATALGGYLVLMAILVIYYAAAARSTAHYLESVLKSAATGCALLVAISAPLFVAASWLTDYRRHRAGPGTVDSPPDYRSAGDHPATPADPSAPE